MIVTQLCGSKQAVFLVVLAVLACPSAVHADYVVKNATSQTIFLAVCWFEPAAVQTAQGFGLTGEDKWRLRGWFTIEPNKELVVLKGDLKKFGRNLFFYANTASGVQYSGDKKLRVHPSKAFNYDLSEKGNYYVVREGLYLGGSTPQPELPEGSELRGFIKVDKGNNSSFRSTLSP